MKTEVLLDLDGVLADFISGACKLHGVPNPYDNEFNHGKFEIVPLTCVPPDRFWGTMGFDFWSNLEFMSDGHQILGMIRHYVDVKQITILTSPIKTPGCIDGKMTWINKHLPMFNRQFLIGPGKHVIAGPGKLLIDDYDKNIIDWCAHGGRAIQVPRPWNSLHKIDTLSWIQQQLHYYFEENHE